MVLFSHKDDCKHGFKVPNFIHVEMSKCAPVQPISGGHEGGVHRLDGPQACVCEHHQQGGQQVKTFSRDAPISMFQLQLKNLC